MTTYYVDPGNTHVAAWQANHAYSLGQYACPTNLTTADAKCVYECTTAGTSHATTEPTWDETIGNTTSDGGVTWTARSPDSWDKALLSLQPAADLAVAGDIVYCRGTQNLTAAIDFDTNSGSSNGGYIRFIGCNASGENDGSYFTLNGQDNNINGLYLNTMDWVWLENIKIHSCNDTAAITGAKSYCDNWVLNNVWCHDNDAHGISFGYLRYTLIFRCKFTSNTGSGIASVGSGTNVYLCEFIGNTQYGLNASPQCLYGCIFHANGYGGLRLSNTSVVINCIFDANGSGGSYAGAYSYMNAPYQAVYVGCRFTNQNANVGLSEGGTTRNLLAACYFGNNATDIANDYDVLAIDGITAHVVTGGSDTNHGYVDQTADDFNLRSDASIRAQAIELD